VGFRGLDRYELAPIITGLLEAPTCPDRASFPETAQRLAEPSRSPRHLIALPKTGSKQGGGHGETLEAINNRPAQGYIGFIARPRICCRGHRRTAQGEKVNRGSETWQCA